MFIVGPKPEGAGRGGMGRDVGTSGELIARLLNQRSAQKRQCGGATQGTQGRRVRQEGAEQ